MGVVVAFLAGTALGMAVSAAAAAWLARRRAERLAAMASFVLHEMNTPLTTVSMTVTNLLNGVFGDLPEPLAPWVKMARDQLGRLNAIVGDLRDFVHATGKRGLRPVRVSASMSEIADHALSLVREGLAQAKIELNLDLPAGLPPVATDPDRAARVLASLLFHARKFRLAGPVEVSARAVDGGAEFLVSYRGAPLPAGEAALSLDPLYPALRSDARILLATGAGLGVARVVARAIGADLEFDCAPDGASRAILRLPAAEAA